MPKKSDPKAQKRPTGRPVGWRKEVNLELLKRMASRHSTFEEMSACLGVSEVTLRKNYMKIIEEAKGGGSLSIRDWQFRIMEKNSAQMAIWLGRVILKQNPDGDGLSADQTSNLTKLTDTIAQARAEDCPSHAQSNSTESKSDSSSDN